MDKPPSNQYTVVVADHQRSAYGDEEWRPVPSGLVHGQANIQASSWGRIKSLPYAHYLPNGGVRMVCTKATYGSISKADTAGNYFRMRVKIRGVTYKVHRLVCGAFKGEPPKDKDPVLHEDDNGLNNAASNLSWGTQAKNLSTPRFRALMKERAKKMNRENGKWVANV